MKKNARQFCDTFWGTHGCDLPPWHEGDHLCLGLEYEVQDGEPMWVWQDTGGFCNFWEGRRLAFLYFVCSRFGKEVDHGVALDA